MTQKLLPGDILLYRKRTIIGKIISWWTKSEYCHAAMIGMDYSVLEMDYLFGSRISNISEHFIEPIDIFRYNDDTMPIAETAAMEMRYIVDKRKYGFDKVFLAAIRLCFPRRLRHYLFRNTELEGSTHCSGAVS